jgi:hypothetical protein
MVMKNPVNDTIKPVSPQQQVQSNESELLEICEVILYVPRVLMRSGQVRRCYAMAGFKKRCDGGI